MLCEEAAAGDFSQPIRTVPAPAAATVEMAPVKKPRRVKPEAIPVPYLIATICSPTLDSGSASASTAALSSLI